MDSTVKGVACGNQSASLYQWGRWLGNWRWIRDASWMSWRAVEIWRVLWELGQSTNNSSFSSQPGYTPEYILYWAQAITLSSLPSPIGGPMNWPFAIHKIRNTHVLAPQLSSRTGKDTIKQSNWHDSISMISKNYKVTTRDYYVVWILCHLLFCFFGLRASDFKFKRKILKPSESQVK